MLKKAEYHIKRFCNNDKTEFELFTDRIDVVKQFVNQYKYNKDELLLVYSFKHDKFIFEQNSDGNIIIDNLIYL